MKIDDLIKESVIILDEAHNITSVCEDITGFTLTSIHIAQAIERITAVLVALHDIAESGVVPNEWLNATDEDNNGIFDELSLDVVAGLKESMLNLESDFEKVTNKSKHFLKQMSNGDLFSATLLGEIFDPELASAFKETLSKIIDLFLITFGDSTSSPWRRIDGLTITLQMFKVLSQMHEDSFEQSNFRVYLTKEKHETKKDLEVVSLNFWCFSAGVAMQNLMQKSTPHSLIITSGTLSPMDGFASELGVPFGVQLSNKHVISKDKLLVGVVKKGINNETLSSAFINRNNEKVKYDLLHSIERISHKSPGGMLVFHPSYSHQKMIKTSLENNQTIKNRIRKPLFYEDKNPNLVASYYKCIEDDHKTGALMFAVCRGKLSEGIDFSNEKGRTVCVVGLPFPPVNDPKTVIKQEFLDDLCKQDKNSNINGQQWYKQTTIRAVNQAIGRIIRHINDFGVILLMDERFSYMGNQIFLSSWIRDFLTDFNDFTDVENKVVDFFKKKSGFIPKEKQKINKIAIKRPFIQQENRHLADIKKLKIGNEKTLLQENQTHSILATKKVTSVSKFKIQKSFIDDQETNKENRVSAFSKLAKLKKSSKPKSIKSIEEKIDPEADKRAIKNSLKAYRDSNFDFSKFEESAPKFKRNIPKFKQLEKFFVAKNHTKEFENFLSSLQKL